MIIAKTVSQTRKVVKQARRKGKIIGFIPTMGALHKGHISLIKASLKETGFTVVSIFVNPLQFSPNEDFKKYPRKFRADENLLKKTGVNLLFYPSVDTIYSPNHSVYVEETSLTKFLCGKSRPGHFKGVATVVSKLFNITQPDVAYFGQKDYQQAQVIKRVVEGLNFPVKIKVMPIVREKDGIAMSSRNAYLTFRERKEALVLYQSLKLAEKLAENGCKDSGIIKRKVRTLIKEKKSAKIDYVEITDTETLMPIKQIKDKAFLGLAVFIGKTRLIDNTILKTRKR